MSDQIALSIFLPLFFFIFFGIFVAIIVVFIKAIKNAAAQKLAWQNWAISSGFQFVEIPDKSVLSFSSFNEGVISTQISGVLQQAGNRFTFNNQSEVRGSGKNKKTYNRTIITINIPDTKLHLIVNSKINNDTASGGNIGQYVGSQRYSLEGDFGEFFDVFMPDTTQSEALSILAPDSMLYIMENFSDYDIEINGSIMYLYTYKQLNHSEFANMLPLIERLCSELKLRPQDVRRDHTNNTLVARTATAAPTHRGLKKDFKIMGIILSVGIIALQFLQGSAAMYVFFGVFIITLMKTAIDGGREMKLKRKYKQVIAKNKL